MAMLLLLAALAAFAVLASALPAPLRLPAAALALLQGVVAVRREAARGAGELRWGGAGAPALWRQGGHVRVLRDVAVLARGPLLRLQGRDRDGVLHRIFWWPETLSRADRRRLRLAAGLSHRSDNPLPSVAA